MATEKEQRELWQSYVWGTLIIGFLFVGFLAIAWVWNDGRWLWLHAPSRDASVDQQARPIALQTKTFVGDYVYHSDDRGTPHDPDSLTLKADGTYVVVQMPKGHASATKDGRWRLITDDQPGILLDLAGYPVEIKGK